MSAVIEELENKTQEPDFWNEPENSQKILKRLKTLKDKLDKFKSLEDLHEEIHVMLMLCDEPGDKVH